MSIVSSFRQLIGFSSTDSRSDRTSSDLVVTIPHELGQAEATRRIRGRLKTLAPTLAKYKANIVSQAWTGGRGQLELRALGQGADAVIDVRGDVVRIEVGLPWIVRGFAKQAEKLIYRQGVKLLH